MYIDYSRDVSNQIGELVKATTGWSCDNNVERNKIEYNKVEYKGPFFKYEIKRIIVNDGAVVVIFKDNNKVVVKRMVGDNDDIYSAVAQAVMKKVYGGTSAFHKTVDKLVVKQEKKVKV